MFNPCRFLNTGYSYSICGTESAGYKVTINGRRIKEVFATLKEAHDRINMAFEVYKNGVRV